MSFFISDGCDSCGICETECPESAIFYNELMFEINNIICTECEGFSETICVDVCPIDVILEEEHYY